MPAFISNNQDIQPMISADMFGTKTVWNKMKVNVLRFGLCKVESHFGFTIRIHGFYEVIEMFDVLKQLLPEHDMERRLEKLRSIYSSQFQIIPLRRDTYIFIIYTTTSRDDYDVSKTDLYFFGKKSYYYYQKFKSIKASQKIEIVFMKMTKKGDLIFSTNPIGGRNFDTIYYDEPVCKEITAFIDHWMSQKQIYSSRGICYKTGILLYGRPGTGKSTMAIAIASYLKSKIVSINLTLLDDNTLSDVVSVIKDESLGGTKVVVVLIDELDKILKLEDTKRREECIRSLLLLLDSPQSPSNAFFVATTNASAEELLAMEIGDALLRKGRFDRMIEISGIQQPSTAMKMCKGFGLTDEQSHKVIETLDFKNGTIPQSELQSRILDEIN